MKFSIEEMVKKYNEGKNKKIIGISIIGCIATIVAFLTMYNLIFPAVALTGDEQPAYEVVTDLSEIDETNLNGEEITLLSSTGGRVFGVVSGNTHALANPAYGETENRWGISLESSNLEGQKWVFETFTGADSNQYHIRFIEESNGNALYLNPNGTNLGLKTCGSWTNESEKAVFTVTKTTGGIYIQDESGKYIYCDENANLDNRVFSLSNDPYVLKLGEYTTVEDPNAGGEDPGTGGETPGTGGESTYPLQNVAGYVPVTDFTDYQTSTVNGKEVITNLDGQAIRIMSESEKRILGFYSGVVQAVGNPKYEINANMWNPDTATLNLAGQYWIIEAVNAQEGIYTIRLPEQKIGDDNNTYDLYLSVNDEDESKVGLQWVQAGTTGNPYKFTIEKSENGIRLKGQNNQYVTIVGNESNSDAYFGFTSNESGLKIAEYVNSNGEVIEPTVPGNNTGDESGIGSAPNPGENEKVTGYKIIEDISELSASNLNGKKLVIMSPSGKRILGAYSNTIQAVANPEYGVTQNRWNPTSKILKMEEQYWILEAVDSANGVYTLKLPVQLKGDDNNLYNGYLGNPSNQNDIELGWNSSISYTVEIDPNGRGIYLKAPNGKYVTIYGDEAIGSEHNNDMAYFGYQSTKDETCLLKLGSPVIVEDTGSNEPIEIPESYKPLTNTVTPASSIITLFDYKANNGNNWDENTAGTTEGINVGHTLHFRSQESADYGTGYDANVWVGEYNTDYKSGAVWGIVDRELVNGYPVLSGSQTLVNGSTESLQYLFDKTENSNKRVYPNVKNLLKIDDEGYYYYNSEENYAYYNKDKNAFTVYGDWAVNYDGYDGQFFPFDDLDEVTKETSAAEDFLNHYFGMTITSRFKQENNGYTDTAKTKPTKFQFGGDDDVWVFIDGVLVADLGGIRNKVDLTIDFSKGTVTISDVQSENGSVVQNFSDIFARTGVKLDTYDGYTTLKNNTYHTLKFYYLERGGYASNLMLRYNLTEVPPTEIMKVNQYGDALSGAKFAVYAADDDWQYLTEKNGEVVCGCIDGNDLNYNANYDFTINGKVAKALFVGETNSDGKLVFYNEEQLPYTLSEMVDIFGEKFVLREVKVPDGYRPLATEVHLYIENNMLQSADQYVSGVLTSPTVTVTAPNNLYVALDSSDVAANLVAQGNTDLTIENGQYTIKNFYNIEDYARKEKGTLFAVVLKRNGRDNGTTVMEEMHFNEWDPIHGDDFAGYTVSKYGKGEKYRTQMDAVIGTAKLQEDHNHDDVVFHKDAAGMQATLYSFPGDIKRYYSYIAQNNLPTSTINPQYLVAYYWTSASDLYGATPENTVRIASHAETTQNNAFADNWASSIVITDMENRVFFQKRKSEAEGGGLINNAVFAMYSVNTEYVNGNEVVYYTATDNTKIYLEVDEHNKFTGRAGLSYDNMNGTYTINTSTNIKQGGLIKDKGAGNINVSINGTTYVIEPAKDPHKGENFVGYTHQASGCEYVAEDGTGHFRLVNQGYFVMREIKAPAGYRVNDVEIKVIANNTGVYANAGKVGDGLSVANGAGFLCNPLNQYATEGCIDESLTWMTEFLKVKPGDSFDVVGKDYVDLSAWNYATKDDSNSIAHASGETTEKSEAMTTYIKYSHGETNTIFDYSETDNQSQRNESVDGEIIYSSTSEGQGTKRLITKSGWSTAVLQQDYTYGKLQSNANPETNYTDLRYLDNLEYLFSGSTFVQIVDEYSVDVNVIKTDDGEGDSTLYLDNAKFKLYKFEDGKKLYYTQDEFGNTVWLENRADIAYEFVTATDGDAKSFFRISDISNGTYYLEETEAPNGYKNLAMPIQFVVDYIRDEDENVIGFGVDADEIYKVQDITELTENPYYNANSEAIQYTLTVTNSNSDVDIEVNKLGMSAENGETPTPLNGAKFKLYYSVEDDTNIIKNYYKSFDDSTGIEWTTSEAEAYEFSGENDGNSFIIRGLSSGIYYLEETVVPVGYTGPVEPTKITVDTSNKTMPITVTNSGDNTVTTKTITESGNSKTIYSINVINTLGYELPHSGGSGTYIVYTIGLTLLMLGAGAYIYKYFYRNTKERREE